MATIGKITTASSGSAAIDYAYGRNKMPAETKDWLKQQGVAPATVDQLRNRAVVMSGLNVDPEYAKTQMKATRDVFSTRGKQTTRVIQSFPESDLDPANPHDWQRTNQLGLELAQKAFPDYQVAVYTQLDGKGHKLHNHIIVNMPSLKTGKKYSAHRDWEKIANICNEISREHGLSIIDREKRAPERRTMAERQLEAKDKYVWKDDLRSRVDKVMSNASVSSYKDFSECLTQSGIIVYERGKSFSYEFLDAEKKHRRARGKTLGADYEKETILNELERQNRQPATQLSRVTELMRDTTSTATAVEQRERDAESRKQSTNQSSQSINGLAISIGRTKQATHNLGTNYNCQYSRKRQLRATVKPIADGLQQFTRQVTNFANNVQRITKQVGRFINGRLGILNQLTAMNKQHEQEVKAQKLRALTQANNQARQQQITPDEPTRGGLSR